MSSIMVANIICMIMSTFLYLMAEIEARSVPTYVTVLYAVFLGIQGALAVYNAVKLDTRLKELYDKEDKEQ